MKRIIPPILIAIALAAGTIIPVRAQDARERILSYESESRSGPTPP